MDVPSVVDGGGNVTTRYQLIDIGYTNIISQQVGLKLTKPLTCLQDLDLQ